MPRPAMPSWWRCLLVSTILLLSTGSLGQQQQDCTSKFMDRDLLTARAAKITSGQPGASPNTLNANQFLVIPGMNFSCTGRITRFKLGVDFRNLNNNNLRIHLWRPMTTPSGQRRYRYVTDSTRTIDIGTGSFSPNGVIECDIPNLNFLSGYMIGVDQPGNCRTRLYYSTEVSPPTGLNIVGATSSTTLVPATGHGQFNGYLLLRPVINMADSCLNGFFSDSELIEQTRLVNINGVVSRPGQQRLFPDIRFTCNGFLTKWIFGAQTQASGGRMPELQIWRLNSGSTNSYTKTNSSLITPNAVSGSPNVHEYVPSTPLQFNVGDILGVHQPPMDDPSQLVMYYQANTGPVNYRRNVNDPPNSFNAGSPINQYDYPLVSVEIITTLPSTTVLPSTTPPMAVITSSSVQINIEITSSVVSEITSNVATTNIATSETPLIIATAPSPHSSPTVTATLTPNNIPATPQPPIRVQSTETPSSRPVSTRSVPRSSVDVGRLSESSVGPLVAGVVVALLAVGLLIVLAVVIIVMLVTRARSRGSFKTAAVKISGEEQSIDVEKNGTFDNPIYGAGDGSPETRSNFPLVGYEIYSEPEAMENNTLAQLDNAIYSTGDGNYSVPGQQWNERDNYETPFTPDQNEAGIYSYSDGGIFVPTNDQRQTLGINRQLQSVRDDIYESLGAVQNSTNSPLEFFQEDDIYWAPSSDTASLYQQLARKKYREIYRQQITTSDQLGSGQFGQVNRGVWRSPSECLAVAVKTLRAEASEEEKVKFLQEAAIMGQFHHPNIVKLHGVVTVGEPVIIVIELMKQGDLRQYLHRLQPAPGELAPPSLPQQLLGYCRQIASGMEYLSKKSFVHRDLAARNILVDDERTCKIADFGMSRDLYDDGYYVSHGGKIPIKWTAPEALGYHKYSTASDVWSFGVLMYEIWSLGHKPFEGKTNNETVELVESGYRLSPPPGCPRAVYKMVIDCWHPQTSGRPPFSRLVSRLSQPDNELLKLTDRDKTHPQSTMLGAPLETASNLHSDLQKRYHT